MQRPESNNLADVTLAVLAGGAGTRMGIPKALLRIGDEPILTYLLRHIAWPGPTLLVTAPATSAPPGVEGFSAQAVDPVDGNGPLQGIHTALQAAATPLVVITTVDMPKIGRPILQWLIGRLLAEPDRLAVMGRRPGEDGIEPFPSIWRTAALPQVADRLQTGRRSVQGLLGPQFHAEAIPTDWPADIWLNINFPQDFEQFIASHLPR